MKFRKQPDFIVGEILAGAGIAWCTDPTVGAVAVATGQYEVHLPPGYRLVSATALSNSTFVATILIPTTPPAENRITTYNSTTGAGGNVAVRFVAARI
jgi:hypothetical protein